MELVKSRSFFKPITIEEIANCLATPSFLDYRSGLLLKGIYECGDARNDPNK